MLPVNKDPVRDPAPAGSEFQFFHSYFPQNKNSIRLRINIINALMSFGCSSANSDHPYIKATPAVSASLKKPSCDTKSLRYSPHNLTVFAKHRLATIQHFLSGTAFANRNFWYGAKNTGSSIDCMYLNRVAIIHACQQPHIV